jgi:hypothetical protein
VDQKYFSETNTLAYFADVSTMPGIFFYIFVARPKRDHIPADRDLDGAAVALVR